MPALALVLFLAAAPAVKPPDRAAFVWPSEDVLESIDVPGVSVADGVPVRMHVIHVKRPAEQMLQRFATAFDKAGFYMDPHPKRRLAQPHLTGLDVTTMIAHTVILQPHEDGTTTCILGEANLSQGPHAASPPPDAPLMPGASAVLTVQQEGSQMISFEVKAPREAVQAHYRGTLPKAGWGASHEPGEEDLFLRGGQFLRLLVRDKGAGVSSVVLIRHG